MKIIFFTILFFVLSVSIISIEQKIEYVLIKNEVINIDKNEVINIDKIKVVKKEDKKIMSIERTDLRELVKEVLTDVNPIIPFSNSGVEILMMTSAQESLGGFYLRQIGMRGSTRGGYGIYSIELTTHNDIWDRDIHGSNDNFLSYKKDLEKLAHKYYNYDISLEMNLTGNLPYQILMARLIYFRVRPPLPNSDDVLGLACYYKLHFNTRLGKAIIPKVIYNYRKFAL